MVFDVEAISTTGDISINVYQNAVLLDPNFIAQNPVVSFTNQLFPSSSYTTTENYTGTGQSAGRIRFVYTHNSGIKSIILSTYTRVVTISIEYTTSASTGSISWFTGIPIYRVVDGNNTEITGIRLTIPSELNNVPLPVELASLTSKFLKDKIQLNWVTKTEVNNYGFNVERRINESNWNYIGFVEGNGTTTETKEYSFTDEDLFAGGNKFYYRLKQIDNDGSFKYSDIVEVEVVPTQFELSQNYPNPFNPSTTIRFSLPQQTSLKINIYNMLGELVQTLAEGTYEAGFHKVTFSANGASSLPSGAYVYRIEGTNPSTGIGQSFVQSKKMILIK
ncbi:MAG: T9SS type A sorting domain-containing protein [Ignavibacteriaceae bacterium]|nr:T9SS type A sorting domain-containing protein [Ignavibacteriaceae bacterium]